MLDFILGVIGHREISHGNNKTPTFQRPLSTGAVLRKGIELGRGADVFTVLALRYNVVMHKEPKHCVTELQNFFHDILSIFKILCWATSLSASM